MPTELNRPITPLLGLSEVIDRAQKNAVSLGWNEPAGAVFYAPNFGVYGVQFFNLEDEEGLGG